MMENPKDEPATAKNDHKGSELGGLRWILVVGGIAVIVLLAASFYWPGLTERTKFFTGNLLNLVIALAVIAQVLIYRKQWDAMIRAIQRQEVDLRQWIEIQPLRAVTETHSKSDPPTKVTIDLCWRVLNDTRLPLDLERIDMKICRYKDWDVFEIVESATIPPAGSDKRNFYVFFVPLELTRAETKEFLKDGAISLSIAIRITWIDAIGERREHMLGDLYDCTINQLTASEKFGKGATFVGVEKGSDDEGTLQSRTVRFLSELPPN